MILEPVARLRGHRLQRLRRQSASQSHFQRRKKKPPADSHPPAVDLLALARAGRPQAQTMSFSFFSARTLTTFFAGLAATSINSDRKSTRLNSSHGYISYAVFCLKKKKKKKKKTTHIIIKSY